MKKEEAYAKIVASKELVKEYNAITDESALKAFLSEVGYSGDAKDFITYVKSKSEGEIDDAIAEKVAGGKPKYPPLF